MKQRFALAALAVLAMSAAVRGAGPGISGDYVEVRTAEVYTGGCIMGSEGETSGREAIMAWRVGRGAFNGVALDGLSIVAVVAADSNLGTHELGGAAPTVVKTVIMIDERARPDQQQALVAMAKSAAPTLITDVVRQTAVPIAFQRTDSSVKVTAGAAALDVATKFEHSMTCGAIQWFDPLARTSHAEVGLTRSQTWTGSELGMQWKQLDRKSSFYGTFAY